ncbi:MAG: clostripain-related cysteine peptidase [Candidatus Heimdallarchaeota archaeon]
MNSKKMINYALIIIIFVTSFTPLSISAKEPEEEFELELTPRAVKNWTFMIYFCADTRDDYVTADLDNSGNWLASAMLTTINALYWYDLLPGSEVNLNVIALFDHPYSTEYPYGQCKMYEVRYNNLTTLANYGAKNMGSPYTLRNFIDYCKDYYPANNYALVLNDHGRGYAGLCYDYHATHESFEYALGDCLSVPELQLALDISGGVDVMIFDTCLGGSFEIMWELEGLVDYVVAHPRDILYALSRDTSMTAAELAQVAYDFAEAPVLVPTDPYYSAQWPTSTIYSIPNMISIQPLGALTFKATFTALTQHLVNEVYVNLTLAQKLFRPLRGNLTYPTSAFKSKAMMVDLGDFCLALIDHADEMTYGADISYYASHILSRLSPSTYNPIVAHTNKPFYDAYNFTGYSICFPNSRDMYKEYLYAHLYEDFAISDDTYWDEFIFAIYPPNQTLFDFPIPEYWEEYHFFLHPCDPTINLHIFIDTTPYEAPLHIGYAGPFTGIGMGIDVDVPGASFEDTLIFGSTMITIPAASLPQRFKDTGPTIRVVVNASTAASASQDVNVTVRHVDSTGIVWEESKTSEISIGQVISTNVTTDEDTWTDWEELEPPLETKKFDGFTTPTATAAIIFTAIILPVLIKRKRKEK